MLSAVGTKKPQKLKISNDIVINQIQVHPLFTLLFAA